MRSSRVEFVSTSISAVKDPPVLVRQQRYTERIQVVVFVKMIELDDLLANISGSERNA